MALIKYPECGTEESSDALNCQKYAMRLLKQNWGLFGRIKGIGLMMVLLIMVGCASVPIDPVQSVIELPGKSKKQNFELSLQWIAHTFKSAKAVLEYKNYDEGKIMGNIVIMSNSVMGVPVGIKYIMTIDVKDAKARITIEARAVIQQRPHGAMEYPCSWEYYGFTRSAFDGQTQRDIREMSTDYENWIRNPGKYRSQNW